MYITKKNSNASAMQSVIIFDVQNFVAIVYSKNYNSTLNWQLPFAGENGRKKNVCSPFIPSFVR